jgi:hypothetical protein
MDTKTYNLNWRKFHSEYEKNMESYNTNLKILGYKDSNLDSILNDLIKQKQDLHNLKIRDLREELLNINIYENINIKKTLIDKLFFKKNLKIKNKIIQIQETIEKEIQNYKLFYMQQEKIALTLSKKQEELNKKIINDTKNQRKIINDFEIASEALKNNDESSLYCLIQWDLTKLFQISKLWKRLKIDGFLSPEDWSLYVSARKPIQKNDNITLIRRTYEDIVVMPKEQYENMSTKKEDKSVNEKPLYIEQDESFFDDL